MPFTPAHAAAALPFRRSRLVWSALVIGTMAPDFEYFIRLEPHQPYGHGFPGVFLLTLPLALITLWLFHAFVKAPVVELLPEGFQRRLAPYMGKFRFGGAARFGLIVTSILLGMFTHLIWDSFTHGSSPLVQDWPPLQTLIYLPRIGAMPLYKILQHGSTLFGLTVLAIAILAWYRNPATHAPASSNSTWRLRKMLTLAAITFIALAVGIVYASLMTGVPTNRSLLATYVGELVVAAIAVAWWEFVLLGIVHSRRIQERAADGY